MTPSNSNIQIGTRRIGEGQATFIIAEAGVNHDGSLNRAIQLIDAAADAGADAVKFQMFRADDLVTATARTADYQKAQTSHTSQRVMLQRLELGVAEFAKLREHASRRELIFIVTPFSVADLTRAIDIGTQAIKIASTDLTNTDLVIEATKSRLPIILSTGASAAHEIESTVSLVHQYDAWERFVVLHCVSSYPTPLNKINLRVITALRDRFGLPVGLSDHTMSTRTGGWAVACGASVLEKHLTLDQSGSGPDHAMSLNPTQFAEYVRQVCEVEVALGSGEIGMTDIEREVRSVAAKSVVSTVAIGPGITIDESMLTLKRPGTGIPASDRSRLVGRKTKQPISADTLISWDMVE